MEGTNNPALGRELADQTGNPPDFRKTSRELPCETSSARSWNWARLRSRRSISAKTREMTCAGFSTCMPTRLFKILEEGILPRMSRRKARPGTVEDPGVLKQGPGYDLDHLHELVNEPVRKFPDHGDIRDNTRYSYRTVLENVSHLTPEVLGKVSQLVAESGHAMVRKSGEYKSGKRKSDGPLRGRCDSFVVECTTRRTSTCCGMRCVVWCAAAQPCSRGWRQWQHRSRGKRFQKRPGGGGWYLDDSRELERRRRFRCFGRRASEP